MRISRLLFVVVVLLCRLGFVFSQGEANNWYFGQNAGITFNTEPPTCLTDGQTDIKEGCATMSDPDGNLMFYTDGANVWDKNHNLMPNGTGLTGDPSSSQSGIFVPNPANANEFYVFTVSAFSSFPKAFSYSILELNANGGLGDIDPSRKNITLFTPPTEQVTATISNDGQGFWVLGAQNSTTDIYSYYVGATGLNATPVVSTAPRTNKTIGYMKVSPDGSKVVKLSDPYVEIYEFDNTTGQLSNPISINVGRTSIGFAFSPNGSKIYIPNGSGTSRKVSQFDISTLNQSAIEASKYDIASSASTLQIGPDQKVYINLHDRLGVIENPNEAGTNLIIDDNAIDLCGGYGFQSFPQFIQSNFSPAIVATALCLGDSTAFRFNRTASSVTWDFGDPSSGSENVKSGLNVKHLYATEGTYTVTATYEAHGVSNTTTKELTINRVQAVSAGADITKCLGEAVDLSYTGSSDPLVSHYWSSGENTSTISVNVAGTYWVESSYYGCKYRDTIAVIDGDCSQPTIDTVLYCNQSLVQVSAEAADTYQWSTGETSASIVADVALGSVTVDLSKKSTNELSDGDFSQQMGSFTSDYNSDQNINPGSRYITSNLQNSPVQRDHTTGSGNFFVVSTDNSKASILEQTGIPVIDGQEYVFSFWMSTPDQNKNGTDFHVEINGSDISGNIGYSGSS